MEETFNIKPWMIIVLAASLALLASRFDPIVTYLEKTFGKNSDAWTFSIVASATAFLLIALWAIKKWRQSAKRKPI